MLQGAFCNTSTCIKLPFVTKIFVLSIFEWPFKTGFTVICNMTSWSNSFQTLVLQDECFGKNSSSFLDFTRNYKQTSGILSTVIHAQFQYSGKSPQGQFSSDDKDQMIYCKFGIFGTGFIYTKTKILAKCKKHFVVY